MKRYTHLSLIEREKLFAWKQAHISIREIAKRLGRNVGTVSREWKRHTKYGKQYIPSLAQKRADLWGQRQRYKAPLKEPLVFLYVRERLRSPYNWSPETIAGRLPIDHSGYAIDDETIYRYIYGKKQRRMKLWKHLRNHRKKRMQKHGRKVQAYARLTRAIPIRNRPPEVNERKRTGDWESDNMEGKRSDANAVSVTVDRLSRIIRLKKLVDHIATTKADTLIEQFQNEEAYSLTVDRGPENSEYERVTKETGVSVYACEPYHSWEKGTVENTIGRVRWFIPKGKSVDGITQEKLTRIGERMNNTPRKCLDFLTPIEFHEKIQTASYTS